MTPEKLKITAVSYLNTKPFLYGLLNSPLIKYMDIELSTPAESAVKLKSGMVDIGLVPVAALPDLQEYHLISDYCIGSESEVGTVCLFSEVPMEEIECIILDHHSKTSVLLIQILLKKYWKKDVQFIQGTPGFKEHIHGTTAGLVIGDRAISLLKQFPHRYDLATAWNKWTGQPFVFAVWVSLVPLDPLICHIFNNALTDGIHKIEDLIKILPSPNNGFDLNKYFRQQISYRFDEPKKQAMVRFLNEIEELHNDL